MASDKWGELRINLAKTIEASPYDLFAYVEGTIDRGTAPDIVHATQNVSGLVGEIEVYAQFLSKSVNGEVWAFAVGFEKEEDFVWSKIRRKQDSSDYTRASLVERLRERSDVPEYALLPTL